MLYYLKGIKMFDKIIYESLNWIYGVSTKITSWSWCKLYSDRKKGYGYKKIYDRKKLSNDDG